MEIGKAVATAAMWGGLGGLTYLLAHGRVSEWWRCWVDNRGRFVRYCRTVAGQLIRK